MLYMPGVIVGGRHRGGGAIGSTPRLGRLHAHGGPLPTLLVESVRGKRHRFVSASG